VIIKKALSLLLYELTPSATILKASISRPESVSSKIDNFGSNNFICSISFFFFSPPEKPTLSWRDKNFSLIPSSVAFSFISFKKVRVSNSFSPFAFLIAFNEVFKKIFVLTPGISRGY